MQRIKSQIFSEIFTAAIMSLFTRRVNIDVITVSAYLQDHGQIDAIGGAAYLTELVEEVPTSAHIFQYAQIVQQKSTLRKLLKAGQSITALGFKEDSEIDLLFQQQDGYSFVQYV